MSKKRKPRKVRRTRRTRALRKTLKKKEKDVVQAELATLVIPEDVDVIDAGLYLETLRDLWDEATLEEQKEICRVSWRETMKPLCSKVFQSHEQPCSGCLRLMLTNVLGKRKRTTWEAGCPRNAFFPLSSTLSNVGVSPGGPCGSLGRVFRH